jgi:membrane-associated phospholipid phosphatase
MYSLIKKNSAFFLPYIIFLLASGTMLSLYSKENIHLFINQYHSPFADIFFSLWTNVGLGWLIIPIALLLACIRLRYVIISLFAYLLTFTVNDTLKQIKHTPRPIEVFTQLHQQIYQVPGVEMYHWNSFPSGHSAIAFCLFCIVALSVNSKFPKLLCFVAALLVGYSRMYLSEHFLIDVFGGSILGVVYATLSFELGTNLKWLDKFPKMDKPLLNLHKHLNPKP